MPGGALTQGFERQYEVAGLDDPVSEDEAFMAKALALADTQPARQVKFRLEPLWFSMGNSSAKASISLYPAVIQPPMPRLLPCVRRPSGSRTIGYPGSVLYVTIEPCLMCVGAMVHARVARVVFGAKEPKAGALMSHPKTDDHSTNHRFEIVEGVLGEICGQRMSRFFAKRR